MNKDTKQILDYLHQEIGLTDVEYEEVKVHKLKSLEKLVKELQEAKKQAKAKAKMLKQMIKDNNTKYVVLDAKKIEDKCINLKGHLVFIDCPQLWFTYNHINNTNVIGENTK